MRGRLCRITVCMSVCISAIQEKISRLESNVFHFQARKDFLLEGGSLVLCQSYTWETVQNKRQGSKVR